MRVALITWRDAVALEAADDDGQAKAQVAILTECGFLIDESPEAVMIGMENHEDTGDVKPGRWRLSIPRQNILKMYVVDVAKAFPKKSLIWQA